MYLAISLYSLLIVIFVAYSHIHSKVIDPKNYALIGGMTLLQLYPVALFTVIVGFRYYVGGDFSGYEGYFNNQNRVPDSSHVPYEYGFYLIIEFLHFLGLPAQSLFVVTAFIQALLLVKIISIFKGYSYLIILFYFLTLAFIESLNTVRQSIAFLSVIISVYYFRTNKLYKGILFLLISLSFHLSSLIAIPIIIVLNFVNVFKYRLVVTFVLLIVYTQSKVIVEFAFQILSLLGGIDLYSGYLAVRDDLLFEKPKNAGVGLYVSMLIDIYIIYRSPRLYQSLAFKPVTFLYSAFVFGAILYPIAIESAFMSFSRALMYFYGMKFIIMGAIFHICFKQADKFEKCAVLFMSLIYFVWFYSAIYKGAAHSSPYIFYNIF